MADYKGETKRERVEKLVTQLKNERQSFDGHWRELADFIEPRRLRVNLSKTNKGEKVNQNIIDSSATFAARILESGMMAGITSPARPWKRLTTPNPALAEVGSVKLWLHDVNQTMDGVFSGSTLYDALPQVYSDMGTFATGCMFVDEDDEDVIRCHSFPVGTYWLGNDHLQRVRVFAREYRMTVRQIVEQFAPGNRMDRDWSNVSDAVKNAYERNNTEEWRDVGHVIYPNDERSAALGASMARYKPFASCYYEIGERGASADKFLAESGYDEFPVMAPRWRVIHGDVYGTNSPGMIVLGDVKALQKMKKLLLMAIGKKVKPPMVASPEMKSAKLTMLEGEVNYVVDPEGKRLRPLHPIDLDLSHLKEEIGSVKESIYDGYFTNLFLMLAQSDPGREFTATEIMERKEEKLIALGPTLERTNKDLLSPLVDRTFACMMRRGMVPEPPEELYDVPLKVEYISMMAWAQKAIGLTGLERFVGFIGGMLQATPNDLSLLDKVDRDQLVDEYAEMTGIPPRVVVPDERVAEIRAQRAQAAEMQREAEMLATAAPAVRDLGETPMDQGSALDALLGNNAAGLLEAGAGV